jgi:hypothetical protein
MKSQQIDEGADIATFFGVVLVTVLVALVLPNLSALWSSSSKSNEDDFSSRLAGRMAERDTYRYNARMNTPSVFDAWSPQEASPRELDDDEITVHSLLTVHNKEEDDDDDDDNGEISIEVKKPQSKVEDTPDVNSTNWRCACEGGFLPPGLLQSFGGAEAVIRMSTGQCYHKQA